MKRRIYGLLGAAAIAAFGAACKEDPLADTGGSLRRLDLEYAYREVIVADSVRTFAIERDALNTPLSPTATVRSCNTAIATVSPVSDAPQQRTGFYVKAVTYGTTCVIAEAGALADTMQVATFPASIAITSGPDSILSLDTVFYSYEFRDRGGNPVTGVPAPTFSTSDATRAQLVPTPLGSVRGIAPGLVTLTVTGVGTASAGVSASKLITIIPGSFTGGIVPAAGDPGDTIKLTNAAGGPGFDSDTRVTFNGVRAFTFGTTVDSVKAIVPGIGAAGGVPLLLTNMGPVQAALQGTFTSNTASFADPYDAVNDDPGTAPEITANGDYYVILSGSCVNGVGGADCDDFFQITNSGGADVEVTVNIAWFTGADVDGYGLDPTFDFCTFDGGCVAATGANPEQFKMTVPAGETWFIYLNLWVTGGSASTLTRVRVSGLP